MKMERKHFIGTYCNSSINLTLGDKYCIARKVDGELKVGGLVVWVETTKLKSANISLYAARNDAMHAVALLAQSSLPLQGCTCS